MREVLVRPLALDSRLACALPPRPLVGQGWESQVSQQTRRGVQLPLSPWWAEGGWALQECGLSQVLIWDRLSL